jgi:hypothetical protein
VLAQTDIGVDPLNMGWQVELVEGVPTVAKQERIPAEAFGYRSIDAAKPKTPKPTPQPVPSARSKIHEEIQGLVEARPGATLIETVVVFQDDIRIPAMPVLDDALPRDTKANMARLKEIEEKIAQVKAARAEKGTAMSEMLARDFGGRTLDSFWLINGYVVEMPIGAIEGLVQYFNKIYIYS